MSGLLAWSAYSQLRALEGAPVPKDLAPHVQTISASEWQLRDEPRDLVAVALPMLREAISEAATWIRTGAGLPADLDAKPVLTMRAKRSLKAGEVVTTADVEPVPGEQARIEGVDAFRFTKAETEPHPNAPVLRLDGSLVGWLKRVPVPKKVEDGIYNAAEARWRAFTESGNTEALWLPYLREAADNDTPGPIGVLLARMLWKHSPRFKELRERHRKSNVAAAPIVLVRDLTANPKNTRADEQGRLHTPDRELMLQLAPYGDVGMARHGAMAFVHSYTAKQLMSLLFEEQHRAYLRTGCFKRAAQIDFEGGLTQLTEMACGNRSSFYTKRILEALESGTEHRVKVLGEKPQAVWFVYGLHERGSPIQITLNPVLQMDGYQFLPRTARLWVPLALTGRFPKPVGNHRTKAPQASADQLLLIMAAERSNVGELDGDRFVLPFDRDKDRRAIADDAGLYRRSHADLSKRWLARLEEGDDSQRQTDLFKPARAGEPVISFDGLPNGFVSIVDPGMAGFLEEQRRLRATQSRRGKRSAAKKRREAKKTK